MAGWLNALKRTHNSIFGGLGKWLGGRPDADVLDDLEAHLVRADVAPRLAMQLVAELERNAALSTAEQRAALADMLETPIRSETDWEWQERTEPCVILIVGINGSGKTTTSAKLAWQGIQHGRRVMLAAADTFRAAGSDQLKLWAADVGCDVVGGQMGADAAAVAYDAVQAAIARKAEYLIIDTAGRMHTKAPLMDELKKIKRSIQKVLPNAPQEVWIVLDASIGQNAISQARLFHEAIPLSGAVISKLDGSSRGGFIFSVQNELGVPVKMVGLGEAREDLAVFSARNFVLALLGMDEPDGHD